MTAPPPRADHELRLLLIAYEFPPVLAAQSLRWYYLANGLAARGARVDVLTPAFTAFAGHEAFPFHPRVRALRTWPGPFVALTQRLARGLSGAATPVAAASAVAVPSFALRLYAAVRKVLDNLLFPDVRSEWYPFARRRLAGLLRDGAYDLLISSHEPGVDLLLGAWAQRRFRLPWLVDLADPLLSTYTPRWRRWLDKRVERMCLSRADGVLVTTDRLVAVLCQRHALDADKFHVIPQGFPAAQLAPSPPLAQSSGDNMQLLFTGTFYRDFRHPQALADALRQLAAEDIAFSVVGDNTDFAALFAGIPNVRFLGKQTHRQCLDWQRQADVLINIGNQQSEQIPGKLFEYLGAGRPILHIQSGEEDAGADLLLSLRAGERVSNDSDSIRLALQGLHRQWRAGALASAYRVDPEQLRAHSWDARSAALEKILRRYCRTH